MIVKDWALAAADEIGDEVYEESGPGTGISSRQMTAIIIKHCPFKPDVAYMPVPRCDSCRRWARPDPNQDGICTLWKGNKIVVTTSADYGCVRWEAKQSQP